uniref:Cell wall hydrolase n=1 Tax=Aromatoleum buckelii TaxID=200254 RepID=A0ABX1MX59_9RHOO
MTSKPCAAFCPTRGVGALGRLGGLSVFALCVLVGSAHAAGEGERAKPAVRLDAGAEVAKSKAETLEEKASSDGAGVRPGPREAITPGEAQAVDPKGKEAMDDPLTCLARSIYWETKGEDVAAMQAVANVVMNRLGQHEFPDTVCGVVKQGQESGACQFSWWCDGRPDDVAEPKPYAVAKEVARKALNGQLLDRTHGATYFHHKRVTPRWSTIYTRTATIGAHHFYKPPEAVDKPRRRSALLGGSN